MGPWAEALDLKHADLKIAEAAGLKKEGSEFNELDDADKGLDLTGLQSESLESLKKTDSDAPDPDSRVPDPERIHARWQWLCDQKKSLKMPSMNAYLRLTHFMENNPVSYTHLTLPTKA